MESVRDTDTARGGRVVIERDAMIKTISILAEKVVVLEHQLERTKKEFHEWNVDNVEMVNRISSLCSEVDALKQENTELHNKLIGVSRATVERVEVKK